MNEIINIEVGCIVPCPENPRKKINQEELDELAQSIKSIGLLQPITVRRKSDGETHALYYEIVCGHRRFEAAKLAGMAEIPCIVRELSDEEAYEIMVTENLQRKDVDPFDEAEAFNLLQERGYDTDVLATKFGKSKTYVLSRLKLKNLHKDFRLRYEMGDIDFSHCLIIARLDESFQVRLLKERYNGGYNDLSGKPVRDLKFAIANLGLDLSKAIFDTSACENCPKNSGCASLFLDMKESVCQDADCFANKYVDKVYPNFEKIRKRNPDFFILENYSLEHLSSLPEIKLVEKLRKEEFVFKKMNSWEYESANNSHAARFNIDNAGIIGFSFDYGYGMIVPREKSADNMTEHKPWKNDWGLNRLAEEREERTCGFMNEALRERISAIDESELPNHVIPTFLNQLILAYLFSACDVEKFGFSSSMSPGEAADRIESMSEEEIQAAILGFIVDDDQLDEFDPRFLERMFPELSDDLRELAERKFLDEAKSNWCNYGEVTDEMIENDLKERLEKANEKNS